MSTPLDKTSTSLQVLSDSLKTACRDYSQVVNSSEPHLKVMELGHSVRHLARCLTLVLCAALGEINPDVYDLESAEFTDSITEDDEV